RCIVRAQRRYAPGVLSLDIMSGEEAINAGDYEPVHQPQWVEEPHAAVKTANRTAELTEKLKAKQKQPLPMRDGLLVYESMPETVTPKLWEKFYVGDKRPYLDRDGVFPPARDTSIKEPELVGQRGGDDF